MNEHGHESSVAPVVHMDQYGATNDLERLTPPSVPQGYHPVARALSQGTHTHTHTHTYS